MYFPARVGRAKCQESSATLTIAILCHLFWQLPKSVAINSKDHHVSVEFQLKRVSAAAAPVAPPSGRAVTVRGVFAIRLTLA
jgi:hypothetical protein